MAGEEAVVRTVYDAFNDRDFDRALSVVSDDAEWTNVPTGETLRGRDGLRQFLQVWDGAFPEGRIDVSSVKTGEGFAVVEFVGRGTNSGSLKTPAGDLPPTNRSVELRFCDVIEVSDGRISGGRTYWDMASLMAQLGMMPEPPPAAG